MKLTKIVYDKVMLTDLERTELMKTEEGKEDV